MDPEPSGEHHEPAGPQERAVRLKTDFLWTFVRVLKPNTDAQGNTQYHCAGKRGRSTDKVDCMFCRKVFNAAALPIAFAPTSQAPKELVSTSVQAFKRILTSIVAALDTTKQQQADAHLAMAFYEADIPFGKKVFEE
ncbi:hypothetical protein CYMTET_25604 [Cymbomonas tetramitiformis]|uniref:Uncharacterized protein n=1 Tax=Cymbomonas tetramitiformis TaxID=36881 RepID=A0AAE0FU84_9CHLO|nr:hypothetical protein CYMTET_25604 [Cymbomonas tetramitiformis]